MSLCDAHTRGTPSSPSPSPSPSPPPPSPSPSPCDDDRQTDRQPDSLNVIRTFGVYELEPPTPPTFDRYHASIARERCLSPPGSFGPRASIDRGRRGIRGTRVESIDRSFAAVDDDVERCERWTIDRRARRVFRRRWGVFLRHQRGERVRRCDDDATMRRRRGCDDPRWGCEMVCDVCTDACVCA